MNKGRVVEDGEHSLPFVHFVQAQPHLDRKGQFAFVLPNDATDVLHGFGIWQEARAASVACLEREGATHVDVQPLVAHRAKHLNERG